MIYREERIPPDIHNVSASNQGARRSRRKGIQIVKNSLLKRGRKEIKMRARLFLLLSAAVLLAALAAAEPNAHPEAAPEARYGNFQLLI